MNASKKDRHSAFWMTNIRAKHDGLKSERNAIARSRTEVFFGSVVVCNKMHYQVLVLFSPNRIVSWYSIASHRIASHRIARIALRVVALDCDAAGFCCCWWWFFTRFRQSC